MEDLVAEGSGEGLGEATGEESQENSEPKSEFDSGEGEGIGDATGKDFRSPHAVLNAGEKETVAKGIIRLVEAKTVKPLSVTFR